MRRWGSIVALAVLGVFALPAASAFAHTGFLGSDPADGSVVASAPPFATLRFSEDVLLDASRVTLIHLGPGTEQVLSLVAVDGGATLHATLPTLARGAYLLRFEVVDPADLHQTVGTVSFGVGVDAPPSEASSQRSSPWWVTGVRGATDAALIAGVGAAVVMVMATRRRFWLPRRAPALAAWCAVATAVGWIILFLADVAEVGFRHARWRALLIASDPGRRALIGLELAAGAWAITVRLRRSAAGARLLLAKMLLGLDVGFIVLAAVGGHTDVGGSGVVGFVLRFAHFASFCGWLGTVAVLWWVGRVEPGYTSLWTDSSRIAAYGLALTGVSGLLLSSRVVATVTALFATAYGRAVVAKMLVLLLLAVVGAFGARRVARGGVPRVVPVEIALVVVALLLAGFLSGSAPALGARFEPLPAEVPQIVTHDAADLTVSTLLEPARPGPNLVRVSVLQTRRPAPGPVDHVTVTVARADGTIIAERDGTPGANGVLEWADVALEAPGSYQVRVNIDRPASGVPDLVGSWTVDPTPVPRASVVVSDRRWSVIALPLAGGWIAAVAAGGWMVRRRRHGSKRYPLARTVIR
jgi:copper transport protein